MQVESEAPGARKRAARDARAGPLHAAAVDGDAPRIRELLLAPDLDVNARDNRGRTALLLAVRCNRLAAVEALLAHPGARADIPALNGTTTYALALRNADERIWRALLDNLPVAAQLQDADADAARD
jgi:ankyrin repeat protein